ncbi:hypothetical protein H4582DRAFT_948930 [Lactarius indigo]|nr:hypothetical protein H4582DRAFT_948930 [Lactarius indigo]
MSTSNTGATLRLQPPRSVANKLTSNDDTHLLHDSWKQRSNVSCNVLHWRSGAICPLDYNQDGMCLSASDSSNSGQAFPSRLNTPPWANSVPDSGALIQTATPSHGCQYQHFPYMSHKIIPYSGYPTRSVDHFPLSRFPVPRQCGLAFLSPYVSWEDELPINESQDRFPASHPTKDPFLSESSLLAPATGLFPVSGIPNGLFLPDGRQALVSPAASDAPTADNFPGSHEELQLPDVWTWMHTPTSAAAQIDPSQYPVDNARTGVVSYNFQDGGSQALSGSRCAPSPEPERQLRFGREQVTLTASLTPIVQPNSPLVASSVISSVPLGQGRSADAMERCEKKNWCSLCEVDFSQPQVLSRHKKDKHKSKESCAFCKSFKWSRGRPYLYKRHLRTQHFQILPTDVRQKSSKPPKENLKLQVLVTRLIQSIRPPSPFVLSLTMIVR